MTGQGPLRGKRGKERRLGERIATDFAARQATLEPAAEVDFDIGDAEASIEDHLDAERRAAERTSLGGAGKRDGGITARVVRPALSRMCW